jgi:hypothetical protein
MLSGKITEDHRKDTAGRPAGGTSKAIGVTIMWQNGPLGRGEHRLRPNGASVEDVIALVIGRLKFYQANGFACQENTNALTHLRCAADCLDRRTVRREADGTEGTHKGT